ncbi:MAG TPA: UDP-N-acetylmuramoyl-L-alanine--D-glutamate ligase [Verrucomicrobiae bacterium]|nr:UDP-N-acetylmuramoyl-L-alanine--D-glutamate ligase [Verrucomicrobiae bacterium]
MKFELPDFAHKDVVFVGMGKGRSMAGLEAFLKKYGHIKSFTGVHRRHEDAELYGFLRDYDPATTIFLKNEAVPSDLVPVPYTTIWQLFFQLTHANNITTIGITGTKGKSTTTSLTAAILQHAGKDAVLAGNIGVSPWEALAKASSDTLFVLELSSYQLSDLTISPHISACINLYNDHTDWHGSLQNYWEAKHNIMRFAGPNDTFIYNPDFTALQGWAADSACHTIAINPSEKIDLTGAKLFGEHNVLNALIAREIARQLGVSDVVSLQAIQQFTPLSHRMQKVATVHGRTYIDDAIGMTPESTLASLAAVTQNIGPVGCLILGGQDRDYDFTELMQTIADHNVPCLILFPETEAKMKAALPTNYRPQIFETSSMDEAVRYAAAHTPEESVVLLSTAAPSYLLWKDFEDKGDQFQAAVTALD